MKISVNGGSAAAIGSIGSGSATASTLFTLGYNTRYNWTIDTPGNYQLAINYTITAP
jgi:hypothetical protein